MPKTVNPEMLSDAWRRYTEAFGDRPHGTEKQMAALLEFCRNGEVVVLPMRLAILIYRVFLPKNPNKMRSAAPEVIEAAKAFKSLVEEAIRKAEGGNNVND